MARCPEHFSSDYKLHCSCISSILYFKNKMLIKEKRFTVCITNGINNHNIIKYVQFTDFNGQLNYHRFERL